VRDEVNESDAMQVVRESVAKLQDEKKELAGMVRVLKEQVTALQKRGSELAVENQRLRSEAKAQMGHLGEEGIVAVRMGEESEKKWGAFNSAHEAYGVLLEEVEELKAHVWMNQFKRDLGEMRKEALDVASVALRIARELRETPEMGRR
jgi:hypothetical protein